MQSRAIFPEYSKKQVNKAGNEVREGNPSKEAINIIENWRASHNHVLNTWQVALRRRCAESQTSVVFAQRLKRKKTIFDKLSRESDMQLARMHDIAGCRLIFQTQVELDAYRAKLHQSKGFKHILRKDPNKPDKYNYIKEPSPRGYRGIHDVYEYRSRHNTKQWDGLLVEIQYRTIFQHAWATAVEVAGSVTGNQAKFDRGDEKHKEFFRLTSEIIARAHENQFSCKASLSNKELLDQFASLERQIKLLRSLSLIEEIKKAIPSPKTATKQILILKFNEIDIDIFTFDTLPKATKRYFTLENQYPDSDIVLVKSETGDNVRSAFRNYFSDVTAFIDLVNNGIKILKARPN